MATGVHLSFELLAKCCNSQVRILELEPGPWEAIDSAEPDLFSFESSLHCPYPQTPRRDALEHQLRFLPSCLVSRVLHLGYFEGDKVMDLSSGR